MTWPKKILLNLFLIINPLGAKTGIIKVPVADLVGAPILNFGLDKSVKQSYKKIAVCGQIQKPWLGCPRIHQALFNEIVEIIDIIDHDNDTSEVCLALPSVYFMTQESNQKRNIFWTLKDNILILDDAKISKELIPPAFSFSDYKNINDKNIVTLEKPYYDGLTKKIYCPGTRFVKKDHRNQDYIVWIYDNKCKKMSTTSIPAYYIAKKPGTEKEKQAYFLKLVKRWSSNGQNVIPYVWGGASFIKTYPTEFIQVPCTLTSGTKITTYKKPDMTIPRTGFDCAGLILRAAQIAGIPYFYKNTFTLARSLKPVESWHQIENGDLIWIPGHVMIISDIENGKLIEARGYSHGYGIIHETTLDKVFAKINNYQQLANACHMNKKLKRMNSAGAVVESIKEIKILKLSSVWSNFA